MQPKLFSLIMFLFCVLSGYTQLPEKGISTVEESFSKPLTHLKNTKDSLLGLKRNAVNQLKRIYTNPIQFNTASAEQHGLFDSSYIVVGPPSYIGGLVFNTDWAVLDIPLQVNYQYSKWAEFDRVVSNFSFQYNRDNYLSGLKNKLLSKDAFKNLLPSMQNPWEDIKQQAQNLLRDELNGINAKYNDLLKADINSLGPLDNFFNSDIKSLREKFLTPETIKLIQEKETRLTSLQSSLNTGQLIDTKEFDSLKNSLQAYKGVQEIIQTVERHKSKWESSGLLTKLKEWDVLNKEKIMQFVNEPSTIISTAKQKMNLNGVQRFFFKTEQAESWTKHSQLKPTYRSAFFKQGCRNRVFKQE